MLLSDVNHMLYLVVRFKSGESCHANFQRLKPETVQTKNKFCLVTEFFDKYLYVEKSLKPVKWTLVMFPLLFTVVVKLVEATVGKESSHSDTE